MFIKMNGPLDKTTMQILAGEMDRLTTPDKHDMQIAKFGKRMKVMEIAEIQTDNGQKRVEGMGGEMTLRLFEKMIKEMPEDHIGVITVILGTDFIPNEFMAWLFKQSKVKNFNIVSMVGTRTTKEVFDNFDDPYGRPIGTA